MPIFYINPRFGNKTIKDGEGKDLPGLQEAKEFAFASAREIVARDIKYDTDALLREVTITDESGRQLASLKIIRASP
jgi:hypothetical protein